MAAPTEGTSIPSDGTVDETIGWEEEEVEEKEEKESRASGEKKSSYRGGTGGGSATGGGGTAIRWPSFSLDLDLDLDLDFDLDSLELAGSSRHGQGGKARSSLVRKDAQGRGVLAALHDRITAAATPEESRTIGGTEGEGGSSRLTRAQSEADGGLEDEGPWCSRASRRRWWWQWWRWWWPRGELRLGEGAVAVQLSTAIMQPADFKELAPAPLPEVLQSGKSGVQQGAAAMEMEGGRTVVIVPEDHGDGDEDESSRRGQLDGDGLSHGSGMGRPGWIGGWPRRGEKTDDDDGKGEVEQTLEPLIPVPPSSALALCGPDSPPRTSTLDSQWSLVGGPLDTPQRPDHRPDHTTLPLSPTT